MSSGLDKQILMEIASFRNSNFMKSLHTPRVTKDKDGNPLLDELGRPLEEEKFDILLHSEIIKTPYVLNRMEMVDHSTVATSDIYTPNMEMDYWDYVNMSCSLPAIRVKTRWSGVVKICWPRNTFHHIISEYAIYFGKKKGPVYAGGPWLDVRSKAYAEAGFNMAESYADIIGNNPLYTQPNGTVDTQNSLPPIDIAFPVPIFFSENSSNAIPLYLCKKSVPTIQFSFKKKIVDLLRVLVTKDEGKTWIDVVEPDLKCALLIGVTKDSEIMTPVMEARYRYIEDNERHLKSLPLQDKNGNILDLPLKQSILASSLLNMRSSNSVPEGQVYPFKLDTTSPVYGIFFIAQHEKAITKNDYSNYTTSWQSFMEGQHPIKLVEHKYSGSVVYSQNKMSFAKLMFLRHGLSVPNEEGYGFFSKSEYPCHNYPDVGLVCDKTLDYSLEFHIEKLNGGSQVLETNDSDDVHQMLEKVTASSSNTSSAETNKFWINLYMTTKIKIYYNYDQEVKIDDGSSALEQVSA